MDFTKFLTELATREFGDGTDYVALQLDKLATELPLYDEKELAEKVFELYYNDRERTWQDAKDDLKNDIAKL